MGWWFGRKSAPTDVRACAPAWLTANEPVEGFARSYEAQYDEVYRRNPVGQRSVRLVAGMLGALNVYAVEGDERAAELVQKDGLLEQIAAQLLLHLAGWRYSAPVEGQLVFVRSSQVFAIYRQTAWDIGTLPGAKLVLDGQQVVGPRLAAIPSPSGGAVVDVQCREALSLALAALRQHGLIAP